MLLFVFALNGCYAYVPVAPAAAPVGAEVSLTINDRGRVSLLEDLGPGVRRLRGRVLEVSDTASVVALQSVEMIDIGVPVQWSGEPVRISHPFIVSLSQRQFSSTRTLIAAGAIGAGFVLAAFVRLAVGGDDPGPIRPPDPREPD